jgi:hypothetical protein
MTEYTRYRSLVEERAGRCCEYCLSPLNFSPDSFSIEHIIPRAKGGSDHPDNLALACQGCNNHKFTATTAFDPITGQKVPLYHPRQDIWELHFRWDESFTHLVGISAIGRASIERMVLNRPGLVNLRRVLVAADEHPPR